MIAIRSVPQVIRYRSDFDPYVVTLYPQETAKRKSGNLTGLTCGIFVLLENQLQTVYSLVKSDMFSGTDEVTGIDKDSIYFGVLLFSNSKEHSPFKGNGSVID